MSALSKRAQDALKILTEESGYFRDALERNSYTGREQFRVRLQALRNGQRVTVAGVGAKTFCELKDAGLLSYAPEMATSVSSYWRLREATEARAA